jgi:hypothetical protein
MSSQLYLNDGMCSNDIGSLKNHPLIKDFASVDGELLSLIRSTNPTLLMMVDLAKKIMSEGDVE